MSGRNFWTKSTLGPIFGVMGIIFVSVVIIAQVIDIGGMGYAVKLAFYLSLIYIFFIMDIQLIRDNYYGIFTRHDYVMASMKLFADFVIIFSLLLEMCKS